MNKQMIACCGLYCERCDARVATVTDDAALRERTAALWTALNGVTITPEMIRCTGCAALPGCETLRCITENTPAALENLKALRG